MIRTTMTGAGRMTLGVLLLGLGWTAGEARAAAADGTDTGAKEKKVAVDKGVQVDLSKPGPVRIEAHSRCFVTRVDPTSKIKTTTYVFDTKDKPAELWINPKIRVRDGVKVNLVARINSTAASISENQCGGGSCTGPIRPGPPGPPPIFAGADAKQDFVLQEIAGAKMNASDITGSPAGLQKKGEQQQAH
jgi:hypothetical protein